MKTRRVIKIAGGAIAVLIAFGLWMRWVPYDRHWRKPAHVIKGFLGPAQRKDYVQAKTFFSKHQLTNITAWEGSFETWCAKYARYSQFELGSTGVGKAGHFWTDIYAVTPDGRREFVERIYAKQFEGVWSLEYGLNYEQWLEFRKYDASTQQTNTTP